jgi:hypothetical protein
MKVNFPVLSGLIFAGLVGALAACSNDATDPSSSSSSSTKATVSVSDNISTLSATLRVRCERRSSRSKISVDGNDLTPRNGRFRARVRAAGGTVTTTAKRAVGDEVEFDFDSNRNDIAAGATRIPATFIRARSGPDVVGQILNAQGVVVASRGVECSVR